MTGEQIRCQQCKSYKNPLNINSTRKNKEGEVVRAWYMCRPCNTERCKRYRSTPEGKKKVFDAVYASMARNKKNVNARILLNYHIKQGHIERPSHCPNCKEETMVEGHHKDYSKPLEVEWLCRPCHADTHRKSK